MCESDCVPNLNLCEIPLFSENYCYGGTPDLPCKLSGKESLIDIKSGYKSLTTGVQLAAYALLLDRSINRYGLYLESDGKYKLIEYKDRNDKNIFLSALSLYHYRAERKLL
jgi:hypothetical protein